MTADGIVTGLRIYCLIVTGLAAILGTFQIRRWVSYLPENRMAWMALAFLNLAVFFGTLQTLIQHVPGGERNYVVAIAVTFELQAVAYRPAQKLWRRWQVHRTVRRALRNRS